ncbi:hypothetical protein [Nocardioides convexus]|uniref:hypothetical protein n=1 Tax=Nocardioides convexus TaxID=2712224 RepID=UPI0024181A04|nr:hypothetical protein [Nocardioides convexus]
MRIARGLSQEEPGAPGRHQCLHLPEVREGRVPAGHAGQPSPVHPAAGSPTGSGCRCASLLPPFEAGPPAA